MIYRFKKLVEKQLSTSYLNQSFVESIDGLRKHFQNIPEEDFNKLIELDPTYTGGNDNGRYTRWILQLYSTFLKDEQQHKAWEDQKAKGKDFSEPTRKSQEKLEDFEKILPILQDLEKFDKNHKININTFNSVGDLYKKVDELRNTDVELDKDNESKPTDNSKLDKNFEVINKALQDGAKLQYRSSKFIVISLDTYESSSNFKRPITNWCTAYPDMYGIYTEHGPCFVNLDLNTGDLYQFHFDSEQYMDKNDSPIDAVELIENDSGLKNFYKNYLIKSNLTDVPYWSFLGDLISEEEKIAIVKKDSDALQCIRNPSKEVQLAAINKDGRAIQYIENPSEEIKLAAVKNNGYAIAIIKNPSEELKLIAVRKDGHVIRYIKNPSEAVQLEAIKNNGYAIQDIENPSENVQLAAVRKNGYVIECIENPSEAVQLAAISEDLTALDKIENPSPLIKKAFIDKLNHLSYEDKSTVFKREPDLIQYIENPSEELQLAAVNGDARVIKYIENPTEKVQLTAVKQQWVEIRHIKNPSEAVQLAAIKQNTKALDYIENPSEEAKQLVAKLNPDTTVSIAA